MPRSVLDELETYKIPALLRDKMIKPAKSGPRILLFSRSGFSQALTNAVEDRQDVELVPVVQLVAELLRA